MEAHKDEKTTAGGCELQGRVVLLLSTPLPRMNLLFHVYPKSYILNTTSKPTNETNKNKACMNGYTSKPA